MFSALGAVLIGISTIFSDLFPDVASQRRNITRMSPSEVLIVRPSMLERRAMEREAIERRQNAEHEKWKRYQDERHDWEWERDRTIWKDGNEE